MSPTIRNNDGSQTSLFAVKPSERQIKPFPVSEWVAMSVLQKAIRRNEAEIAFRAALTLLEVKPDRLWRRLSGICFEDIGLADFKTVEAIISKIGAAKRREQYGDDWSAAEAFILSMCSAKKSRAADDLLIAVNNHPDLETARFMISTESSERRLNRIATYGSLLGRAIAIASIIHQNRFGLNRAKTEYVSSKRIFEALTVSGVDRGITAVCQRGFSKTGEVLAILVALLSQYEVQPNETACYYDDHCLRAWQPPAAMGVPLWAYDQFNREGLAALDGFLKSDAATATMLNDFGTHNQRRKLLGGLLFRVESQLVRGRRQTVIDTKLKLMADDGFSNISIMLIRSLRASMLTDLAVLDNIRLQFAKHGGR